MRAGFLTLAVSILVATVACSARACSRSKPAITATPVTSNTQPSAVTSSTKPTSQMQLYEQIQQLGITPERAKLLFSLAIGPLPGVSVPDGARDPHDFCGTLAVRISLPGLE